MANERQTYMPRQANEEQTIDIKQLLYTALHYWYLFAIAVAVALAIGFIINRYSTKVYQTTGTVLIKEGKSGYDATTIMTSLNYGSLQNIDNEIAILKSYTLVDRVVKKMGIEVSYFEKGRFASTEMYKTSPFFVEYERSVPQAVGLTYEITLSPEGNIKLHTIGEGITKYDYILCEETEKNLSAKIDTVGYYQQGEWIDNGYNKIRITKTDISTTDNYMVIICRNCSCKTGITIRMTTKNITCHTAACYCTATDIDMVTCGRAFPCTSTIHTVPGISTTDNGTAENIGCIISGIAYTG